MATLNSVATRSARARVASAGSRRLAIGRMSGSASSEAPGYFLAGLPYIDRVEITVDEDNASRTAAFIAGKYDVGCEFPGALSPRDSLPHRTVDSGVAPAAVAMGAASLDVSPPSRSISAIHDSSNR
jgi:hypothetical protein